MVGQQIELEHFFNGIVHQRVLGDIISRIVENNLEHP